MKKISLILLFPLLGFSQVQTQVPASDVGYKNTTLQFQIDQWRKTTSGVLARQVRRDDIPPLLTNYYGSIVYDLLNSRLSTYTYAFHTNSLFFGPNTTLLLGQMQTRDLTSDILRGEHVNVSEGVEASDVFTSFSTPVSILSTGEVRIVSRNVSSDQTTVPELNAERLGVGLGEVSRTSVSSNLTVVSTSTHLAGDVYLTRGASLHDSFYGDDILRINVTDDHIQYRYDDTAVLDTINGPRLPSGRYKIEFWSDDTFLGQGSLLPDRVGAPVVGLGALTMLPDRLGSAFANPLFNDFSHPYQLRVYLSPMVRAPIEATPNWELPEIPPDLSWGDDEEEEDTGDDWWFPYFGVEEDPETGKKLKYEIRCILTDNESPSYQIWVPSTTIGDDGLGNNWVTEYRPTPQGRSSRNFAAYAVGIGGSFGGDITRSEVYQVEQGPPMQDAPEPRMIKRTFPGRLVSYDVWEATFYEPFMSHTNKPYLGIVDAAYYRMTVCSHVAIINGQLQDNLIIHRGMSALNRRNVAQELDEYGKPWYTRDISEVPLQEQTRVDVYTLAEGVVSSAEAHGHVIAQRGDFFHCVSDVGAAYYGETVTSASAYSLVHHPYFDYYQGDVNIEAGPIHFWNTRWPRTPYMSIGDLFNPEFDMDYEAWDDYYWTYKPKYTGTGLDDLGIPLKYMLPYLVWDRFNEIATKRIPIGEVVESTVDGSTSMTAYGPYTRRFLSNRGYAGHNHNLRWAVYGGTYPDSMHGIAPQEIFVRDQTGQCLFTDESGDPYAVSYRRRGTSRFDIYLVEHPWNKVFYHIGPVIRVVAHTGRERVNPWFPPKELPKDKGSKCVWWRIDYE